MFKYQMESPCVRIGVRDLGCQEHSQRNMAAGDKADLEVGVGGEVGVGRGGVIQGLGGVK